MGLKGMATKGMAMKGGDRSAPLAYVWILPLVAGFIPLLFLFIQESHLWQLAVAAIAIPVAIAAMSFQTQRAHNDEDIRPIGLLMILAGQFLVALTSFASGDQILGFDNVSEHHLIMPLLGAGVALSVIGLIQTVAFRMGSRPEISERELAIAACGLGLIYFAIVAEPEAAGWEEGLFALANTASGTAALFGTLFTIWLVSTDRQSFSIPIAVISLAFASTVVVGTMTAVNVINPGPNANILENAVATIGLGAAVAGYVHPQIQHALAPSVIVDSEVNVRRSIISFSVVLVGPLLIAVNEFTELELSDAIITIGSSALALLVAMHLLGLVRRWVAVEHQGQHDPLTSLPNRPLFFSRLGLTIESARLRETRFATMFLDLDRFKAVNDTLGHDAGDELLRQVAQRLNDASHRVSPDLTVARLGGDEFAIIVPETKDARHAHAIGRLFLDQFLDPFDVGLRDIYVTPSIGMAEFPKDGSTVDELIENADTAMFEAKERGRNTVVAYSPEQRIPGAHRLEIEAALHRAVEREELELYFQPQIDLQTGKIFAVESLIRWVHPTLGRISPDKFVPVAEESSLIDSIGEWIIDEACRSAARWEQIGLPPINVAVNLSPRQFQRSIHLVDKVTRALSESGLSPDRLELELTESLALDKPEEVNETLIRFREMGIRTAIDDFGVGHTGLDYLDRIEVDTLKIDRSFINRIGESGAPLVTAVISLAKGLDLDVIAEGVETRAQVNFLASHGCRYMQGYLFSKPLTGAQLEQVLRNQMRRDAKGENSLDKAQKELPGEDDLFEAA